MRRCAGAGPGDVGAKSGLIEMKDLYYLLDAVRLVERSGTCRGGAGRLPQLAARLSRVAAGKRAGHRGTADTQQPRHLLRSADGAIAAFLGDAELLERTFLTSRERILEQFTA
jgi:hypothetical protein